MVTDTRSLRFKGPVRDESVLVRLTKTEQARLQEYALRRDLRCGQAARQFINERLTAEEAETPCHRSADDDHE